MSPRPQSFHFPSVQVRHVWQVPHTTTMLRFLTACLLALPLLQSAAAHGTLDYPKSRVKRIYEALGQNPRPVWAAQAVALDGETVYYTWNQNLTWLARCCGS
jgi:predicted carbohydrate-binding protein with CBM5 and CBM33 domain